MRAVYVLVATIVILAVGCSPAMAAHESHVYGADGWTRGALQGGYQFGFAPKAVDGGSGRVVLAFTPKFGLGAGLQRFLRSGKVDKNFGVAGFARIPFGSRARVERFHRLADGSFLVIGLRRGTGHPIPRLAIARFNANGRLASAYGNGGIAMPIRGSNTWKVDAHVWSDGSATIRATRRIIKLTPSGALDATFDHDGIWAPPSAPSSKSPPALNGVYPLPDGSVLTKVSSYDAVTRVYRTDLYRVAPDGSSSVSTNPAFQALDDEDEFDRVFLRNGKIYLFTNRPLAKCGRIGEGFAPAGFTITRLNEDESIDTAFGSNGRAIGCARTHYDQWSVGFQGASIVATTTRNDRQRWQLRFGPDGKLDRSLPKRTGPIWKSSSDVAVAGGHTTVHTAMHMYLVGTTWSSSRPPFGSSWVSVRRLDRNGQ